MLMFVKIFSSIHRFSQERWAWVLLFASSFIFEVIALYFQHGMGLAPCTLCIYERIALLGIALTSILGYLFSYKKWARITSSLFWLYSSAKGFDLSHSHAKLQFSPLDLTDTCPINVDLPNWLPLNEWFPGMFHSTATCCEKSWSFLTIEMSQWMIIIFACYFLTGLIILISQFFKSKSKSSIIMDRWKNN